MKISNPIAIKGEDLATNFLKDKGYKIIDRNFRKGYGEIDIICLKNNILVFVEVKTRTSNVFGAPFEAITYSKLQTLIKTAQFYKMINSGLPDLMRIDAISVELNSARDLIRIDHIENIT